jgi:hypothetical protein
MPGHVVRAVSVIARTMCRPQKTRHRRVIPSGVLILAV